MAKYNFKCPACGHVTVVEADNDDSALEMMMAAGAKHMDEVHPKMPKTPKAETMEMVQAEWWKG